MAHKKAKEVAETPKEGSVSSIPVDKGSGKENGDPFAGSIPRLCAQLAGAIGWPFLPFMAYTRATLGSTWGSARPLTSHEALPKHLHGEMASSQTNTGTFFSSTFLPPR